MKSPSGTESAIAARGGGNAASAVASGVRPITTTTMMMVAITSSAPPRRSRLRRTPGSSLLAPLAFIRPIGLAALAKRSDVCDQLFNLGLRQRSSEAGHERTFAEHEATSVDAIVQPIVGPR